MASGTIEKPLEMLVLQHQFTIPSVTINGYTTGYLLQAVDLQNLTVSALDALPSGRTLSSIVYLWATQGVCIGTDVLVQNGKAYVKVYNASSSSVTVTALRLLAIWK